MNELNAHEALERKLDYYKSRLVEFKNLINNSPTSLNSDLIADIDSIELMLSNIRKQIVQDVHIAEESCNVVGESFKYLLK